MNPNAIEIRSLVKIYENMKPKDAARIFEELDRARCPRGLRVFERKLPDPQVNRGNRIQQTPNQRPEPLRRKSVNPRRSVVLQNALKTSWCDSRARWVGA